MTDKERAEQFNRELKAIADRMRADLDEIIRLTAASAQEALDAMEKEGK